MLMYLMLMVVWLVMAVGVTYVWGKLCELPEQADLQQHPPHHPAIQSRFASGSRTTGLG